MDPSAVAMSRTSPSGVLRVWLLGGFSVNLDGRTIDGSAWRGRKPRSLVKLLALSLPHPIDRERILDLLWPELSHEAAQNNLRQTVQTVRRVLRSSVSADSPALRPYGNGLLLWPPDQVWTDVDAFEIAAANASESRAPAAYRAALDLYVGDLLPEDEYEDWAVGRREALRSTRMALLLDLAALHEEAGSAGAAIDALLDVVAMDPLREDAHARLMRLYAESRKPHLARLQYHRLKAALQRELDAEPEPETEELYRRIVRGESGGSARSMA
ncbi:MAG TPA: BTAD domain-containing putative transcriptional regulator, partial [Chloroflexota bacterium]